MNRVNVVGMISAVLFALVDSSAIAAFAELDWKATGDTLITYDSQTGLDWLDITETVGMSKSAVFAKLGAGGAFEGFSFATTEQLSTLFDDANFGTNHLHIPNPVIQEFVDLLGSSGPPLNSNGMYTNGGSPISYTQVSTLIWGSDPAGFAQEFSSIGTWGDAGTLYTVGDSNVGSYLVRAHLSTPPAVYLFGSGLLWLIGTAKLRKVL
jgi:hypothetical protein